MLKLFEVFGLVKIDSDEADKKLDKTDSKGAKLGKTFGKAGKAVAVGAVAAGVGIAALSLKAISLGSDAEEVQNKFDVTFKTMNKDAEKWSKTWSKSVGRSTNDTKKFISDIADLQQGLGMTEAESLDLSQKIVQLGTDLGSFNNVNDATAIEAVSKAMMGEAESAKQLGLLLNVDRVKAYAESQGLVYSELTDAARATLVYELAVTQSQNAIGDAERSSGSYANQMKALQSSIKDVVIMLGKHLIPIATKVVSAINNKVVPVFEKLFGGLEDNMPGVEKVFKEVFTFIGEVMTKVIKLVEKHLVPAFVELFKWVSDNMPVFKAIFEIVFDAIASLLEVFMHLWNELLFPALKDVFAWLKKYMPAIKVIFEVIIGAIVLVIKIFVKSITTQINIMKKIHKFVKDVFVGIGDLIIGAFDGIIEFVDNIIKKFKDFLKVIKDVVNGVKKFLGFDTETSDKYDAFFERQKANRPSGRRAVGGSVTKGASYMVNELQQEIFTPDQNGTITPVGELQSTTSAPGEQVTYLIQEGAINVTIPVEEIEQIKDVNDFFKKIPQLRRG